MLMQNIKFKRAVYFGAAFLLFSFAQTIISSGLEQKWNHAFSVMGSPKYANNFEHFEYVNVQAPKGGKLKLNDYGAFDSTNPVLGKGNAASGLSLIYEQLMVPSLDEVSTQYAHIAQAIMLSDDLTSASFLLNRQAKWHDGKPMTADDVVWSFDMTKKHNPQMSIIYQSVSKAEKINDYEVKFHFSQKGNKELPLIVGQLQILPKHWWTAKNADGVQRSIAETTLEPPLGSGPYKIKSLKNGQSIVYERAPNYWGAKLPTQVGANNFDEIEYISYRDETVALEGFKAGEYDVRLENVARLWATAYNFPARKNGQVVLETLPENSRGIMQAFVPNLRKEKYKDARVRQALNLVFDFEDINRALFFGQYKRTKSFFEGTELASSGLPNEQELKFLTPLRDIVPPEVFTSPYQNPINGSTDNLRANTRKAIELLKNAGWEIQTFNDEMGKDTSWSWLGALGIAPPKKLKRKLVNAKGEAFEMDFLLASPSMEKVILAYKPNLEKLGISVKIRTVDSSQYINRLRSKDFDILVFSWGQSLSPGNEQHEYWGSQAADREGSRNISGIKNKAIDALINQVVLAQTREEQVAATHALDRVLLANHYLIPQWSSAVHRIARWDKYDYPKILPKYSIGFPTIWWFDAQRFEKLEARK